MNNNELTFKDIKDYCPLNEVDDIKVDAIASSILNNGWSGVPILVWGESLVTGSHRITALNKLNDICNENDLVLDVLEEGIAVDVTEIIEAYLIENDEDHIVYDCLSKYFEGTWVEEYKDEIEW